MIVLPGAGVPVCQPTLKDRSAMIAFYDELEHWISGGSRAREKDAALDSELVSRILKNMSSLVGNLSGLGPEMCLWQLSPELYTAPQRRDRAQEVTDSILLVPGNRQAATHRVNAR
jgi:hypothetical protein